MAKSTPKANELNYDQLKDKVFSSFEKITKLQWTSNKVTLEPLVKSEENTSVDNKQEASSNDEPTIEDELNLIRDIMLLLNKSSNANELDKKYISRNLTYILVSQLTGLRKWISATFDLDETSQKETTLDQRFMAASHVIAYVPATCVPFPLYYHLIAKQIWNLLLSQEKLKEFTQNCVAKISKLIITAMIDRLKPLGKKEFIFPILTGLKQNLSTQCDHGCEKLFSHQQIQLFPCKVVSPQASLEIIYSLTMANLDMKYLAEAFPTLLYIQLALESSVSPWKSKCLSVLTEMLKRVKHSVHLLMAGLFINYDELNDIFCLNQEVINYSEASSSSNVKLVVGFKTSSIDKKEIDIKKIDSLAHLTIRLIDTSFKSESKVNFLLLLFDQLSRIHIMSQSNGLLLCTLFGELIASVEPLIKLHPGLFVKFIIPSLDRVAKKELSKDEISFSNISFDTDQCSPEENSTMSLLHLDSAQVSLQILKVLLLHKDKLSSLDIETLKSTIPSLVKIKETFTLSSNSNINPEEDEDKPELLPQLTISDVDELIKQINSLSPDQSFCGQSDSTSELEDALKQLNDPLMPTRAHGLITLKHMIMAMNPEVIHRKKQILELLITSLSDGESYIYLSSINTLESAAILDTATVLPVLLSHFTNQNRTIQERLNTGEVIVRLSKSLGPTAPMYAKEMINKFTESLKDEDALIRVSSLSNLAQICKCLGHSLGQYIIQLINSVQCLLTSDPSMDVKRSALMFIHITLSGIDVDCLEANEEIQKSLLSMLKLVRYNYDRSLDDVCKLHSQLALEEIQRLGTELNKRIVFGSNYTLKPARPVEMID